MNSGKIPTIFNRNLKLYKGKYPDTPVTITPGLKRVVYTSMLQVAQEARQEQDLKELREGFKIIPRLFWTILSKWVIWLVKIQYIKIAQLQANIQGCKQYVVEGGGVIFKVISNREFKFKKKIRVYKKEIGAIEMESNIACFTAHPKKR
jgi:hypothetical protein